MKTKFYILTITVFALFFFSCNNDKDDVLNDDTLNSESEQNNKVDTVYFDGYEQPYIINLDFGPFTETELIKIETLKNLLPDFILNEFEEKFKEWVESDAISHPFADLQNYDEYINLLYFCQRYGKASWALLFNNSAVKEPVFGLIFTSLLYKDLTFLEYKFLFDYAHDYHFSNCLWFKGEGAYPMYMIYVRNLLQLEYDNVLKAIQDLREAENVAEE